MLAEGVRLTLVGMVTVFAFLGLLVALMHASASFFGAFGHRLGPAQPAARPSTTDRRDQDIAIVLAIAEQHAHRSSPS